MTSASPTEFMTVTDGVFQLQLLIMKKQTESEFLKEFDQNSGRNPSRILMPSAFPIGIATSQMLRNVTLQLFCLEF